MNAVCAIVHFKTMSEKGQDLNGWSAFARDGSMKIVYMA